MKNANQIRQKLENIIMITNTEPRTTADKVYGNLARQALALLPCETCGGTKKANDKRVVIEGLEFICREIPCPDCQPKPKQEKSSPSTMWEHLH